MNISSVIVIPRPDQVEGVRQRLGDIDGVEIHAVSPEGKMIVSIEAEDDRAMTGTYEFIGQLEGVLSASMVFHQKESDPETEISVEACSPGDAATIQR